MDLVNFLRNFLLRIVVEVLAVLSVLGLRGPGLLFVFLGELVRYEQILVNHLRWISRICGGLRV